MIIPIKCFTCSVLISGKYKAYLEMKKEGLSAREIFKKLRVRRFCCKKTFLSHIDIVSQLN